MPEMRLQGKVALLAGAGPGMGRATALLFAQHGARVAVVARTETNGIETAQRIGAAGGTAMALSADLADGDAAQHAVQRVIAAYGRLDILYFGAGGFFTAAREYAEVHSAHSGFEAGVECEKFRPHVLLLDIHLGDLNGEQVLKLVRDNGDLQLTKVLAMSGKLTDGQAHTLLAKGFDGYLKTPFHVRQVIEAVEDATAVVY